MTRQEILDVIKNKPYLIGHWIGFKDLTTLHNEWIKSFFRFTQNVPANLLDEAQIAAQLSGIVSEETQLSVLSIVDDVKAEIKRKEAETPTDALGFVLTASNGEDGEIITDEVKTDSTAL